MKKQIEELQRSFMQDLENARILKDLEVIRIKYLSRNGSVSSLFEQLKNVPKEQKPAAGKLLNEMKREFEERFADRSQDLKVKDGKQRETVDLTLPGRYRHTGTIHPITQTIREIAAIFQRMGFTTATGPELEDDWHNFEALNFPPDHPARDMQDTFFISESLLLRTHTSPVQIRHMMSHKPPVRAIMPGRVFRNEAISARSHMQFHQIEGLYVDEQVTFADLKGTLAHFAREYYGSSVKFKFRPTFFPFTEPSADMYISCIFCGEKGCRICKYNGWLEILGSGMVHPNVLTNAGYDNKKLNGFAFGIGIERTAMLKYNIDDIRLFFENDIRFLRQF